MSQIGLTESVKGDARKFEVWRQGRSEVHTITAPTVEVKRAWVDRIKRVLLDQLKELKGERVRQYSAQQRYGKCHDPFDPTYADHLWDARRALLLNFTDFSLIQSFTLCKSRVTPLGR